jgi:hypothetical protein
LFCLTSSSIDAAVDRFDVVDELVVVVVVDVVAAHWLGEFCEIFVLYFY